MQLLHNDLQKSEIIKRNEVVISKDNIDELNESTTNLPNQPLLMKMMTKIHEET